MGSLTNLNSGSQFPPEVAMDAEVAATIAGHVAASDPHSQYLIERTLALLTQGILGSVVGIPGGNTAPFNANTWNPNLGQAHASSVNIAAIGIGNARGNSNLPAGSTPGLIVELDPFLGTIYANLGKTQIFYYYDLSGNSKYSLWVRQQIFGSFSWHPWERIATAIKEEISQLFTIDPPALPSGAPWATTLTMVGARVGDLCLASITTTDLWNTGLWVSELRAVVSAPDTVILYVRNDWTAALDWIPFQVRILVKNF